MGPPTGGHLDVIVVPVPSPPSAKTIIKNVPIKFYIQMTLSKFDFCYYALIEEKSVKKLEVG